MTDSTKAASQQKYAYADFNNNYAYAIQMVVCEMAEHKGGKALVIRMLNEISENGEEYNVIETLLGVKRDEMNQTIRGLLNRYY